MPDSVLDLSPSIELTPTHTHTDFAENHSVARCNPGFGKARWPRVKAAEHNDTQALIVPR